MGNFIIAYYINHYCLSDFPPSNLGGIFKITRYSSYLTLMFLNISLFAFILAFIHSRILHKWIKNTESNYLCLIATYWVFGFVYSHKIHFELDYYCRQLGSYHGLVVCVLSIFILIPILYQLITVQYANHRKLTVLKILLISLFIPFFIVLSIEVLLSLNNSNSNFIFMICASYLITRYVDKFNQKLTLVIMITYFILQLVHLEIMFVIVLWIPVLINRRYMWSFSLVKEILSYCIVPVILYILVWKLEPYLCQLFSIPGYISKALLPL